MSDPSRRLKPILRRDIIEFGGCRIAFQRTLRIPDDGRNHPLPPGLGRFPVLPVDRYADRVPESWLQHGGAFIPMHQREALWIDFTAHERSTASAVKVGIGNVNALTGDPWDEPLHRGDRERKQDYLVVPDQPWLDGINVGDGRVRQFVAVPLGSDYTVEGQVTGEETWGGIQLLVVPQEPALPRRPPSRPGASLLKHIERARSGAEPAYPVAEMGVGAGGRMKQRIYEDPYAFERWQQDRAGRMFVHIANAELFAAITGKAPPPSPVSAKSYSDAGLPWFDFYDDDKAFVAGSDSLRDVWSVEELDEAKIGPAVLKDPSITLGSGQVLPISARDKVRDGEW